MKRLTGLVLAFAASALIGCGDSSVECGEGTTENDDGFCVPTGGDPVTCTDGTMLDQATNTCVIDPASCQGGTVLIGNECVDPTDGVTVDVTEAAEPNGIGINGETSPDPAGDIVIKPVGQKAIVQGNFTARPDRDEDGVLEGDIDTYLFAVDEPTLLEVTVDGVGGSVGGFVSFAGDVDALANWVRFGVSQGNDTAKRQLFIPQAGTYLFAIADSRTLLGANAENAADNKYFATIEKKAIPTATALAFTANDVVKFDKISADEIDFYTAPFDLGFNRADLRSFDTDLEASLIINVGPAVRVYSEEARSTTATNGDTLATAFFAGVKTGDSPLIVVDHVINTSAAAVDYRLHLHTTTATALSSTGGTATADVINPNWLSTDELTSFYFDTNATDQITGMKLTFNNEVEGAVVDQDGFLVSQWTLNSGSTSDGYTGLIRTGAPGRYYLLVTDPAGAAGDDLVATSKYQAITPATLTFNTPVAAQAMSTDYNTQVFTYTTGADWELLHTAASAATDDVHIEFIDPEDPFSYGLLNPYYIDGGTSLSVGDTDPWYGADPIAGGTEDQGVILKGLPTKYLVTAWSFAGAGTFDIGTSARTFQDEGMHAGVVGTPFTVTHAAEALTGGTKRYLFRTTPGQSVKIDVAPAATLNASITRFTNYLEGGTATNAAGVGLAETVTAVANASGYIAFSVDAVAATTGTYDLTITATAPTPPFYALAPSTTAWVNVCQQVAATDVTPANSNEGVTAEITLPTGFKFFDADVTTIRASTNGWLTFLAPGAPAPAAVPGNVAIPTAAAPNAIVAAYWDDLVNTRICTQTVGTKFFVQWRGQVKNQTASTVVAFEAILDTADDSVELVYAPYHRGTGGTATAGVENATGNAGTALFANLATPIAGKSFKFTH